VNRVIFDTNIYGFLVKEKTIGEIEPKIVHNDNLLVYGCSVVRKEIRKTGQGQARNALLMLYDHITKERKVDVSTETEKLAEEYYQEAKSLGRIQSLSDLWDDLLIVAAASLNDMDIVFTGDEKTMRNDTNVKAYGIVNIRRGLRSPTFYSYEMLKRSFI
jgi:predicted nucleic acid-binding protein